MASVAAPAKGKTGMIAADGAEVGSMAYEPRPIDTSGTEVPREIGELTELLAKNAHEIWAQRRQLDGWVYGAVRDDKAKLHPCLVPYEQLPEGEKSYDRVLAIGTLKLILALGYRILKP
jgi:hypothetical protein